MAATLEGVLAVEATCVFNFLTLTELSCLRSASTTTRACLETLWTAWTNELFTNAPAGGSSGWKCAISAAHVQSGRHVPALRWLISRPLATHIQLAPGTYLLGDMNDPSHVDKLPPAVDWEDDESVDNYNDWCPRWKPGYGEIELSRDITLQALDTTNTVIKIDSHQEYVFLVGAPVRDSSGAFWSGCCPICVTLRHLCLENVSAHCFHLESCRCGAPPPGYCKSRPSCQPYAGPILHMQRCTLKPGHSDAAWCCGRALLEDVTFEDNCGIFIGDEQCLVYIQERSQMFEILHEDRLGAKWEPPIHVQMHVASGLCSAPGGSHGEDMVQMLRNAVVTLS